MDSTESNQESLPQSSKSISTIGLNSTYDLNKLSRECLLDMILLLRKSVSIWHKSTRSKTSPTTRLHDYRNMLREFRRYEPQAKINDVRSITRQLMMKFFERIETPNSDEDIESESSLSTEDTRKIQESKIMDPTSSKTVMQKLNFLSNCDSENLAEDECSEANEESTAVTTRSPQITKIAEIFIKTNFCENDLIGPSKTNMEMDSHLDNSIFVIVCNRCENRREFNDFEAFTRHVGEIHKAMTNETMPHENPSKWTPITPVKSIYPRENDLSHQDSDTEKDLYDSRFNLADRQRIRRKRKASRKCVCATPHKRRPSRNHLSHSSSESTNSESKRQCRKCKKGFKRVHTLKRHIYQCHPPTKCIGCSTEFDTGDELKEHVLSDHSDCEHCPICCSPHWNNKEHLATHFYNHKCTRCSQSFSDMVEMQRHRNRCRLGKELSCSHCNEAFNGSMGLRRHAMLVHQEERPFKCTKCELAFKALRPLSLHLKLHKSVEKRKELMLC